MGEPAGDEPVGPTLSEALRRDLVLFRGFITRIKHTQLRQIAPLTLRLLALHRLDIALFAHMAPGYLRARAAAPLPTAALFARFEHELREGLPSAPAPARHQVAAMLRHEAQIWRTGRSASLAGLAPYPRLRPGTVVERFDLDVLTLAKSLCADRFTVPATVEDDRFVLYRSDGDTVVVEEIDPFSAWLLSRLDGTAAPASLAAELAEALGADAASAVRDLLADAAARGLLDPAEA